MTRERSVATEGEVLVYDGVAVLFRGDAVIACYQKAARLHRTRWLFDVIDEAIPRAGGEIIGFLIVLPSADRPDGPTLHENHERLQKLGSSLRRLITTPIGDTLRISVVRAAMRASNLGHSGTRFVTATLDEGLSLFREGRSPKTPTTKQIRADITALYAALGEPAPKFPRQNRARDESD